MVRRGAHVGHLGGKAGRVSADVDVKVYELTYDYRFKAAWTSDYEKEPVTEIFGEIDVLADSLVEMADKIIAASNK